MEIKFIITQVLSIIQDIYTESSDFRDHFRILPTMDLYFENLIKHSSVAEMETVGTRQK